MTGTAKMAGPVVVLGPRVDQNHSRVAMMLPEPAYVDQEFGLSSLCHHRLSLCRRRPLPRRNRARLHLSLSEPGPDRFANRAQAGPAEQATEPGLD
jgi:hypothetical protein